MATKKKGKTEKKQEKKELTKIQELEKQLSVLDDRCTELEDDYQVFRDSGPSPSVVDDMKCEVVNLPKDLKGFGIDCTGVVEAGKVYLAKAKALQKVIDTKNKSDFKKMDALKKQINKLQNQLDKEREKEGLTDKEAGRFTF
jgi:uncharacterized protein YlxW (UPF0749 family)